MSVTATGAAQEGEPPSDVPQLSIPDALAGVEELLSELEVYVDATDYLKTEVNTERGVEEIHPGQFAIANLKKIRTNLLLTYGEQLWTDGKENTGRFSEHTLVDHPHDDYREGA